MTRLFALILLGAALIGWPVLFYGGCAGTPKKSGCKDGCACQPCKARPCPCKGGWVEPCEERCKCAPVEEKKKCCGE